MIGNGIECSRLFEHCSRLSPDALPKAHWLQHVVSFLNALKAELPAALAQLQRGNIAPVDSGASIAIGPGMAVFTRYTRKVVDTEGKQISGFANALAHD